MSGGNCPENFNVSATLSVEQGSGMWIQNREVY